ncbi:MAG: ribose-5-phosphate isomerase RpiA [Bacillota bacterium]
MVKANRLKFQAALYAVSFLKSRMVIGLGHGSTALLAIKQISARYKEGYLKDILCIPASNTVEKEAQLINLPLTTLNEHPVPDITIDGADEVNPALDLIKGGGGALLKEKMLAQASKRELIIVDETKLSPVLGEKKAVPVEVIPFGWQYQAALLDNLGAVVKLRYISAEFPYETDQGNFILDCDFGPLSEPVQLASQMDSRAGIVGHGLFLGLADDLIVAGEKGIRHLQKNRL